MPVEPDAVIAGGVQQGIPRRQPAEIFPNPDEMKKRERPPLE
jgi:hypothetical protein